MKKLVQVLVVAVVSLTFVLPVAAAGLVAQNSTMDNELNTRYEDFENFAQYKVRQLNRNHKFSRSNMKITKQGDGTYLARYHQIDDSTMKVKVRRSKSASSPYVGTISYREKIYESSASDPGDFNSDQFVVVEVIPNRHIFSYRKGSWN